jgi:hypothetical protein
MTKLAEELVNQAAKVGIEKAERVVRRALNGVSDPEQRFVVVAQIAASLFGTSGALFQIANPGTGREEAARATLAHIGSMLNAYTN